MTERVLSDYLCIELGLYPTIATRMALLGINPDIDTTSTPEDIWPIGGIYPWKASATLMEVLSSSASDTPVGVGARTIRINGLSTSFVEITEVVTLNGTTPVLTVNQYLRINSCSVLTAGNSETNVGDIDIRDSGGGTVRDRMSAGVGASSKAVFTVPAGKTMHVTYIFASINLVNASRWATIGLYTRLNPNPVSRLPFNFSVSDVVSAEHKRVMPIPIVEKTDVALRILAISGNNTSLSGGMEAFLTVNGMIF